MRGRARRLACCFAAALVVLLAFGLGAGAMGVVAAPVSDSAALEAAADDAMDLRKAKDALSRCNSAS